MSPSRHPNDGLEPREPSAGTTPGAHHAQPENQPPTTLDPASAAVTSTARVDGPAALPADTADATEDVDPAEVRARYIPSGKAVGRIRVQPRSEAGSTSAKHGRWWELPVLAIIAVAVAVIVKTFMVQPFYIPSGSMEKTLHGCTGCNGDKILVNKPIFDVRSPHPGDIIVFSRPDAWPKDFESPNPPKTNAITGPIRWFAQLVGVVPPDREDLVKRVIAVGGQTVKCCDAQGRVQVSDNGPGGPFRSLDEPYTYLHDPDGPEMAFSAVTVPHGRLWVMGDHRTNSADSRFHCVAGSESATAAGSQVCDAVSSTVPISHVIGKAFVIAWPPSRWRTLGTPRTFKTSALAAATYVPGGLPLVAGILAVFPLWVWRRRMPERRRG